MARKVSKMQLRRVKFVVSTINGKNIFDLFCFRILGSTKKNSLAIFSEAPGKDFGGRLSP